MISHAGVGVTELTGKPGQILGNLVMPAQGKSRFWITGDMIHASSTLSYGLESKQVHVRIQSISAVEIVEGRLWWLLWIGISLLFVFFIGLIPLIAFFFIKQRWLAIHGANSVLVLFFKPAETERASQFSQTVLDMARELNTPAT